MSEQEKMDHLLRDMMATTPPPALSPGFDRRLQKRLRPRRLDATGRRVMIAYAILALLLSIWAMRSHSIDWSLITIAIVAPLLVVAIVQLRQRPKFPGSLPR